MCCNTEECQAIKKFVEGLMASKPRISWSVLEESGDLSVAVRLYLADRPATLILPVGQDGLSDSTKDKIAKWIAERI